ncbi:glycosyltransferase [Paenibacillus sp. GP183]|uniref:glycosyltransferase n=1 Tax=Paenibacillus sp. GP183 TaxID=1882751 RepID=UPI00089D0067|nr:glycosyltransferase [Paenibacillus sp. GP183]SEC07454.1 Glycosyltransferase involved in cell wall bisynthesis [Paenibacillus sp. GP183]
MRKKVLFIMNNLSCGGAEKALISLLETMDYSVYDVDLFLFKHEGLFLSKIPEQVHLLEEPPEYKYYDMSIKKAVLDCLKIGRLDIALSRAIAGYMFKSKKNRVRCEQRVWKYISKSLKNIDKKYDIAVGYLENNPIYFCIDKVNANKKIGFIHNDYDKLGMDPLLDQKYFEKLDHLVTVSEECGNILKNRFPIYQHKVEVMHNIVSPATINKLSFEQVNMKDKVIKLVSVGRLNYQKGFELAIETCKELVQNGYPVKWYIIGEGEERGKLEKMIDDNNLQGIVILLGIKENPYPYIKEADIYVQPSRFEGKSIAIDEAKILQKPIVVTNFNTAKDQIKHNENGIIVDMNSRSIFEGITMLIDDEELRNLLKNNLSNEELGTESEINKLYTIFEKKGQMM